MYLTPHVLNKAKQTGQLKSSQCTDIIRQVDTAFLYKVLSLHLNDEIRSWACLSH